MIVVQHPYTHFLCTEAFPLNSFISCISITYQVAFFVLPFLECSLCCLCYKQLGLLTLYIPRCLGKIMEERNEKNPSLLFFCPFFFSCFSFDMKFSIIIEVILSLQAYMSLGQEGLKPQRHRLSIIRLFLLPQPSGGCGKVFSVT